jgi:hypothetical protein
VAKYPLKLLSPRTHQAVASCKHEGCVQCHRPVGSGSIYISNKGAHNHFTITFGVDSETEEYGADYPIS